MEESSVFELIRKLSSEEMQAVWTRALLKGDTFFLGRTEYKVTVYTDRTFRIKNADGRNYTFRIYINCFMAEGKEGTLLRDVEGEIRRDLINQHNPFHSLSDVFKLTVRSLKSKHIKYLQNR